MFQILINLFLSVVRDDKNYIYIYFHASLRNKTKYLIGRGFTRSNSSI